MGNPELLNTENIEEMKQANVTYFQLSLDGLEETHDEIRYRGSFAQTIKGIRALKKSGVPVAIMFTVGRYNADELIKVIDLVVEFKVEYFDFGRFIPIGSGKKFIDNSLLTPAEFHNLLLTVSKRYDSYTKGPKYNIVFGGNEPLWGLLKQGKISNPEPDFLKKLPPGGCSIGHTLTILPNGDVLACRRLPESFIGSALKDNIFDLAKQVILFREKTFSNSSCNHCELIKSCGGCQAMVNALSGNVIGQRNDPYCWKENLLEKGGDKMSVKPKRSARKRKSLRAKISNAVRCSICSFGSPAKRK